MCGFVKSTPKAVLRSHICQQIQCQQIDLRKISLDRNLSISEPCTISRIFVAGLRSSNRAGESILLIVIRHFFYIGNRIG